MAIQIHKQKSFPPLFNRVPGLTRRVGIYFVAFSLFVGSFSSFFILNNISQAASHVFNQTDQISDPLDMGEPYSIATDNNDNYYIGGGGVDHFVRKFSPVGVELLRFGNVEWSSNYGELGTICSIAIKSNSEIYVSDCDNDRINVYNAGGQFLREISTYGAGQPLGFIYEIVFDLNDHLYITHGDTAIIVLDENDQLITEFSNPGSGPGQFDDIWDIDVDASGYIYIGDYWNNCIHIYDSGWNFISTIADAVNLDRPNDVAIHQSGVILVADDPRAAQKMVALSGQMGVPFTWVEDEDADTQYGILGYDLPTLRETFRTPN